MKKRKALKQEQCRARGQTRTSQSLLSKVRSSCNVSMLNKAIVPVIRGSGTVTHISASMPVGACIVTLAATSTGHPASAASCTIAALTAAAETAARAVLAQPSRMSPSAALFQPASIDATFASVGAAFAAVGAAFASIVVAFASIAAAAASVDGAFASRDDALDAFSSLSGREGSRPNVIARFPVRAAAGVDVDSVDVDS